MSYRIQSAGGRKKSMETQEHHSKRNEIIVITFRDSRGKSRTEMKFLLSSRLSVVFHWWMVTKGVIKA